MMSKADMSRRSFFLIAWDESVARQRGPTGATPAEFITYMNIPSAVGSPRSSAEANGSRVRRSDPNRCSMPHLLSRPVVMSTDILDQNYCVCCFVWWWRGWRVQQNSSWFVHDSKDRVWNVFCSSVQTSCPAFISVLSDTNIHSAKRQLVSVLPLPPHRVSSSRRNTSNTSLEIKRFITGSCCALCWDGTRSDCLRSTMWSCSRKTPEWTFN